MVGVIIAYSLTLTIFMVVDAGFFTISNIIIVTNNYPVSILFSDELKDVFDQSFLNLR